MKLSVYAVVAAFVAVVSAHGHETHLIANGVTYNGPIPNTGNGANTPIRVIRTLEPITNLNSNDLRCGQSAQLAKGLAEVDAGSSVSFSYGAGKDMKWPHPYGPVLVYAYKCENARTCQPGGDASWAKIAAFGFQNNTTWELEKLTRGRSSSLTYRVPTGLPTGDYLFRHEIIALHVATSRGSEHYVVCNQVRVVGGQDTDKSLKALGADTVAFPGAYKYGLPGLVANVFSNKIRSTYKMPGPKVFNPTKGGAVPETTSKPTPKPTPSKSSSAASFAPTNASKRCPASRLDRKGTNDRRAPHSRFAQRSI